MVFKFDMLKDPAAIVIPHRSDGRAIERKWLDATLDSILNQTDPNWVVIIPDGDSPSLRAKNYLRSKTLRKRMDGRIIPRFMRHSDGPGHARNIAVEYAYRHKFPFVVYIDADDIMHPKRVEVARKTFAENPRDGVIYSTFSVINEHGNPVPRRKLSPSIREILESHQNPPVGKDAWIDMATKTGYANLTSSTSVKTNIAYKHPFPATKVSEDYCAWLAYSAGGAIFFYTPEIPTLYRIPQNTEGSVSRSREGGKDAFYKKKCEVDEAGVRNAIRLALGRRAISKLDGNYILAESFIKQAVTMERERQKNLTAMCVKNAIKTNPNLAKRLILRTPCLIETASNS